ncbi:transglutaminase-like domain-containing protein [Congregibacter sp.]|uniref:transglutaminase-like domain-containing protein n=1 Tax=Congregibacter sp. TaxID=2744308 RepID=UPI003F6CEE5A
MTPSSQTLSPSWFLDSDSEAVRDFASQTGNNAQDPVAIAEELFYAVRDGIRYDPYQVSRDPSVYRASVIAGSGSNWCVPKSVLLTACARARGIPARLGFADVLNHLTSDKLSESMGTDLFAWHGYAELWLNEQWVKLSTAFNIELCERFGVEALEFDPINGALMHPYDTSGRRHMEYVRERGSFDDLPLDAIFETFDEVYPTMAGSESTTDSDFHG